MTKQSYPIVNPMVVLREEFDDLAILFNPDTGTIFGLNRTGLLVWKCLAEQETNTDLIEKVLSIYGTTKEQAVADINKFIEELVDKGFVQYRF